MPARVARPARQHEVPGERADRLLDLLEVARIQRHGLDVDAGDALDLAARNGADLAEILRDDQVGGELLEQFRVDLVERPAVAERVAHGAVDLGAPELVRVDARGRDDRHGLHLGWVVALVRTPDEVVSEPEGGDDLGRARNEGDDAHVRSLLKDRKPRCGNCPAHD